MKLLFWLNSYLPDLGGIQTLCASLVPELKSRGHDVLVLAGSSTDDQPESEVLDGVDIRRADTMLSVFARDPARILRCSARVRSIVDEFDPDLIHIHPCGPETTFYLQYQRSRNRPTLLTMHNNFEARDLDMGETSTFGRALLAADLVNAVSEDAQRWLEKAVPQISPKLITIHNGVPDLPSVESEIPVDPPVLLYAGRYEEQKRVDLLLEAFRVVADHHPTVRLRMIGAGSMIGDVRQWIADLGLADRVDLSPQVDPGEMPGELRAATAVVLASDYEGLPMLVLEAGQQGRPVISTAVGGVAEAVDSGVTGLLVQIGDYQALATKMLELLGDIDRCRAMGDAARRRVDELFSMKACAANYERAYQDTLLRARGVRAS